MLLRQKCTGPAIRKLRPFSDWCVTMLTRSSMLTPSDSSRKRAVGGRLSAPPLTSFSNAGAAGGICAGALSRVWRGAGEISFFDKCQADVVKRILRRYGLWKETVSRPLPVRSRVAEGEPRYDYGYFGRVRI